MPYLSLHSPVGDLTLIEEAGAIVALEWGWAGGEQTATPVLARARALLDDYFDGKPVDFSVLPLHPAGTTFQQRVWQALSRIPYGRLVSYGELAASLGSSPRAVGGACGANPIPLLIPCHRVVAADGRLGGYSGDGGFETKANLIALEGARRDKGRAAA